jgi:peptide subunit release factor 1 (eRF1)
LEAGTRAGRPENDRRYERMNKEDKRQFIKDISETMKDALLSKVNRMPEEWDGHELRQLFQDYVKEEINWSKMDRNRKKEYDNARRVNNI